MLKRQTTGSVVCASCGYLVGVNDERCYHCGRRNPGLWGFAPAVRRLGHDMGFVTFVTGLCIVMYVLTLLASGQEAFNAPSGSILGFLGPSSQSNFIFGASGAIPVFLSHRWWTVLSAAWLHGGLLHIFFNLMAVRQLGPAVGELYGPGRMVIMYTVAAIAGFALSSISGVYLAGVPFIGGAPLTVGASAPILGLLGGLVYYGRRTGSRAVHSQAMSWVVGILILGFVSRGIDNTAHIGGFIGGYVAGMFLDPLKPERVTHLLWALICLALSILSILLSVITGPAAWRVLFPSS